MPTGTSGTPARAATYAGPSNRSSTHRPGPPGALGEHHERLAVLDDLEAGPQRLAVGGAPVHGEGAQHRHEPPQRLRLPDRVLAHVAHARAGARWRPGRSRGSTGGPAPARTARGPARSRRRGSRAGSRAWPGRGRRRGRCRTTCARAAWAGGHRRPGRAGPRARPSHPGGNRPRPRPRAAARRRRGRPRRRARAARPRRGQSSAPILPARSSTISSTVRSLVSSSSAPSARPSGRSRGPGRGRRGGPCRRPRSRSRGR